MEAWIRMSATLEYTEKKFSKESQALSFFNDFTSVIPLQKT